MTITRAKKRPAPQSPVSQSAEEFIGAAEPMPAIIPAVSARSACEPGRETRALAVVDEFLPWAAAGGLIPLAGADLAAVMAVQLRMLSRLCHLYGIQFSSELGRSVIASLLGAIVDASVASSATLLARPIPIVGPLVSLAAMPAVSVASTYALGKVFICHFEAGGTLLDFDPQAFRRHFRDEFVQSKERS